MLNEVIRLTTPKTKQETDKELNNIVTLLKTNDFHSIIKARILLDSYVDEMLENTVGVAIGKALKDNE
jgi:hypothetical protein